MRYVCFKTVALLVWCFGIVGNLSIIHAQDAPVNRLSLAGKWAFEIDSSDVGIKEKWFQKNLKDKIILPGSMTTNGIGSDITIHTPWTGSIEDSAWFFEPEYARYRQPGNIKIPFWLQPKKYYKGAAWYQKKITIPNAWKSSHTELFIERTHWETTVWIDDKKIGVQNSLGTPHIYDLTETLPPGQHTITIRVDNRIKEVNVGENAHSVSDHTQTNWNGLTGKLFIQSRPLIYVDEVQIYPDLENKQVTAKITINNTSGKKSEATLQLLATAPIPQLKKLKSLSKKIGLNPGITETTLTYPMGGTPLLWDEFHPHLYRMKVKLTNTTNESDKQDVTFGMRNISTKGSQFIINGRLTFMRGTLECAIFPKTGYPPTDVKEWVRILKVAKSYGLNHIRFHSWCPPEAAFAAADQLGLYLQVENSSWANFGVTIGDGKPLDQYIYDESSRMIKAYGNHPSFCFMAYGNEPSGKNQKKYLADFVTYWKRKDPRKLYTTAGGWPVVPENDFNSSPDPRLQAFGGGLKTIINSRKPATDYDWSAIVSKWPSPTISHEIGQWVAYPDFKEIPKYDGVQQAKNLEIFQDKLRESGMENLADSFLLASGKLQVLCYKADIEAALRTPGFGGFQLLDLHDFPGQGTALVGVLNAFWEEKGYVTADAYRRFCNSTVPLVRLPKMIYLNNEELKVPVEIAHFGQGLIANARPYWQLTKKDGTLFASGQLPQTTIPLGNAIALGTIRQSLQAIAKPEKLILTVTAADFSNTWDIWVYPAQLPATIETGIKVTPVFDKAIIDFLQRGGSVLLTLPKGNLRADKGGDIAIGFSSIFWNTAWTHKQAPHTLGILCNPQHPALQAFPAEYHSNWQWQDAMSHASAIKLNEVATGLKPIVRVIDDWFTARPLGLLFECKIGTGKLLVSGIDLISNQTERPEARQLLYSLKKYMASQDFRPDVEIAPKKIEDLFTANTQGQIPEP